MFFFQIRAHLRFDGLPYARARINMRGVTMRRRGAPTAPTGGAVGSVGAVAVAAPPLGCIGGEVWARLRFAAVITAAAALSTSNAVCNPYVLDDLTKVLNNPDIRSLRGLAATLVYPYDAPGARRLNRNDPSRPLTYLSYALNYCLLGPEPWHFRLTNIVAHVACSWSVRALLCALLVPAPCTDPGRDAARGQAEEESEGAGQGGSGGGSGGAGAGGGGGGAGGGNERLLADVTSVLFLTSPLAVGTATYVYARSEVRVTVYVSPTYTVGVTHTYTACACAGAYMVRVRIGLL